MLLEDLKQWLEEGCRKVMLGVLWLRACVYDSNVRLSCAPWKEVFLKVKDGYFTLSLGSSVSFSSGCERVALE